MFRSGSTWQYQVAVDLARRSRRPRWEHGAATDDNLLKLIQTGLQSSAIHILKAHTPNMALREFFLHPGFCVLYSYRDIRDIAFSMAHKISNDFSAVVDDWKVIDHCLVIDSFWEAASAKVVQRYETWIREPAPYVKSIAAAMGIEATEKDIEEIVQEYSLEAQRRRTEEITRDLQFKGVDLKDRRHAMIYDDRSLLHWNHIREGRIGHWESLATREQRFELVRRCGNWLVARGYEPNAAWVHRDASRN
jgi:hypothetical protein